MFYLDQLKDVETDPPKTLELSASTIVLCIAALIPAEQRGAWIQNLEALDDAEWAEAEEFLRIAIEELSA